MIGADPSWTSERSLLILSITKDEAIEIGKKYKQNAIVFGIIYQPAELIIMDHLMNNIPI